MPDTYYSLHRVLQIGISRNDKSLETNYRHYLRHFEVDHEPEEIHYQISEFSEFELPNTYYATESFIGFHNGISLPKKEYALVWDNNRIIEYTNVANRATNLWLQCLLLNRKMSLVHSAGIQLNGKGVIFPAFGGAGKTTLVSELQKLATFRFFGDDYVIVDENAHMFAYPSDFSIYDYHLDLFPELQNTPFHKYLKSRRPKKRYPRIRKFIPGKRIIRKVLEAKRAVFAKPRVSPPGATAWNLDYVKVPVTDLIPRERIGTQTKLFASVFLSRYSGNKLRIEEIGLERLVDEIIGILHVEFRYALIYLHLLSAFGVFDLPRFEVVQRQILRECFSELRLYRALLPSSIDHEKYCEEVISFVTDMIQ